MSNSFFKFKQFTIHQDRCAMKVTTDACLFGAWVANEVRSQKSEVGRVLDIGGGTGLLSLMFAQTNPDVIIDSIEIDAAAVSQAKDNANASPWNMNLSIINADARTYQFAIKYDIIISNPPFYEKEIRSSKDVKNIAHHGDELKLGELLTIIKKNLTTVGHFFLLFPYKRNEEIKQLFKEHKFHIDKIIFVRQSVKHEYFRIMLRGKLNQQEIGETELDEISIWDEQQNYTERFKSLLKDYYLYL